ncbi:MAG: metallopeptidase family protein [Candidatus Pacebacteria bacterium]|nr:metallopeptidase family protein [Candidatus Paceibacterota bacterium]MDD4999263.1 metallopeptidase family protein [Candidatus Paceibacterota bacterium]MDD5545432.1 metallopeptidase family protein [Candidatus Paceibacterota bacterium]
MTKERFQTIVDEALKNFPVYFLEKLKNVAIVIEDEPSDFQKRQLGYTDGNCLLGLYEGIPQTKRGIYNKAMPDKISLFQKNIEIFSEGKEEKIIKIVYDTIWHEIAHHFGLGEEEIREISKKKSQFNKDSFKDKI